MLVFTFCCSLPLVLVGCISFLSLSFSVILPGETRTGALDRDLLDTLDCDLLDLDLDLDLACKNFVSLTCDSLVLAMASIMGYGCGKLVTCLLRFLAVGPPLSRTANASNFCLSEEVVLSMNLASSSPNFCSVRDPRLSHRPSLISVTVADIIEILVRVWSWSTYGRCSHRWHSCEGMVLINIWALQPSLEFV